MVALFHRRAVAVGFRSFAIGGGNYSKRTTDCSMGTLGHLGFDRNQHGRMPGRASRYRKNKMEIRGLKVG